MLLENPIILPCVLWKGYTKKVGKKREGQVPQNCTDVLYLSNVLVVSANDVIP